MLKELITEMLQDGCKSTWLIRYRLEKYHNIDVNNKELRKLLESMETVRRVPEWSNVNNIVWELVK
ncbi:hypothetical protein [Proteus phage 2207-N35]|nr:hypothetical protein [Proteus phage 2207-N35]